MVINSNHPKHHCHSCELKSPLFCLLSDDQLEKVKSSKIIVEYRKGEIIRKQGAQMTHVISVNEGLAKMYIEGDGEHNAIIRIVKPTAFIGGPGIYHDRLHHYSVAALTKTTVCFIDVDLFTELIESNIGFARAFMKDFSMNVISVYNRLLLLTQKHTLGRMADALLYLSDDIFQSRSFPLTLTKQEIADLTGMAKESASKILRDLNSSGIIHWNKEVFEINDYEAIKRISQTG